MWFVPVLDDKERLDTVLNEEAFYRFLDERMLAVKGVPVEQAKAQVEQETVEAVLKYVENPKLEKFRGIHVEVTKEDTIGTASDLMEHRNLRLAIVVDRDRRPTDYVTTGDVRRFLLQD